MKVSTKLAAAAALHLVILVGLLLYHVRTTREAVSTSYELSQISSRLGISSTEQLGRIGELEENAAKYRVTRDEGYLDKFNDLLHEFDAALLHLESLPLSARETAEVSRLREEWSVFLPMAERLSRVVQGSPDARRVESLAPLFDQLKRLRLHAEGVSEASQAAMADRLGRSADRARSAERLSWIAAALALLLSALVSLLIVRFISDSLNRLKAGTRAVAEGEFAYRLETSRNDEFAEVARDFNTMTQRLGELDRMKRDFVSKISHDLKTPLASMQETIEALLEGLAGPLTEQQEHLLRLNHQSGGRLSAIITKLLDLSRLEAHSLEPEIEPHEVAGLVRQVTDRFAAAGTDRGIDVEVDLPDDAVFLECDAERTLQALDNLLENALKFSPDGGTVEVDVRGLVSRPDDVPEAMWSAVQQPGSTSAAVLITVSDSGPGVPDEHKRRIFDRFFQADAGRRIRGGGVGLGLTICQEIVAAHGGTIWVSDRPGGGSAFHVLMPRALRVPAPLALALATPENGGSAQP